MLPYSRGLILDNANNYGIVKTETVFGFGPTSHGNYMNESFNSTEPLEWIISGGNFASRSLQVSDTNRKEEARHLKSLPKAQPKKIKNKTKKRKAKGKFHKCIFKVIRKNSKKNRRTGSGGSKFPKAHKKFMMPLILGLLAAKSLIIPIALKALAFLSTKGLMMGFFSTVMASVLSLKGMFDRNHGYQNRKDDTKTQVEIIHVPSKSEDHVYYDDYKRGDFVPVLFNEHGNIMH